MIEGILPLSDIAQRAAIQAVVGGVLMAMRHELKGAVPADLLVEGGVCGGIGKGGAHVWVHANYAPCA